jgi:hypothetical protein
MSKFAKYDFNKLLKQYKALSVERLELENEIIRSYESLTVDSIVVITSDSDTFKTITSLREKLKVVNQEMHKMDKKIMGLFIQR